MGKPLALLTPEEIHREKPAVTLFDDPNRYADKPHLQLGPVARIGGYQKFLLSNLHIEVSPEDSKLRIKRNLTRKFFDPKWLRGKSVLDLGANGGFFCYYSLLNGATHTVALDIDDTYVRMVNSVKEYFGFHRLEVLKRNITAYEQSADVVFAFALVHWIYSCTSDYGSLEKVIQKLASLTNAVLIVEWIEPEDAAIKFFGHINWNPQVVCGPYDKETFECALRTFFDKVEFLGEVSPTRCLYAAYSKNISPPDESSNLLPRTLGEFFSMLNEENIPYVVSRGWNKCQIAHGVKGLVDLDVVVRRSDFSKLEILRRASEADHGTWFRRSFVFWTPSGPGMLVRVGFHAHDNGYYPPELADHLLGHRIREKMLFRPSETDSFLSLLYHVVFHVGVVNEELKQQLGHLSQQAKISFDLSRANDFGYACSILRRHGVSCALPKDAPVSPLLPFLHDPAKVIYSRLLTEYGGVPYHSRIYIVEENGERRIWKQASIDLAEREYKFLSKLQSRHFPKVYASKRESNYSVCEMEFIDGLPLTGAKEFWIEKGTAFVKRFIHECLDILHKLQTHGITHRDIRAENILIRDSHPVLIDFGWAMSAELPHITPGKLGNEGRPLDGSFCDVYSMGVVLKAVCTYHPEFVHVVEAMAQPDRQRRVTDISRLRRMLDEGKPTLEQFKRASLELAERYTQEHSYDAAQSVLLKVLELKSDQPDVLTRLGELALAQDRSTEAEVYFAKALSLDKTRDTARFRYAVLLQNRGQTQEAIEQFEILLSRAPEPAVASQAHNELGVLYFQQGDQEKAFDHFQQAVELVPQYVTAQKNLAEVCLQRGQMERAVQVYKKILDLSPNDAETLFILGNVCLETGRHQDARFFYERVLQLVPDHEPAKSNLIVLEVFKEQFTTVPSGSA